MHCSKCISSHSLHRKWLKPSAIGQGLMDHQNMFLGILIYASWRPLWLHFDSRFWWKMKLVWTQACDVSLERSWVIDHESFHKMLIHNSLFKIASRLRFFLKIFPKKKWLISDFVAPCWLICTTFVAQETWMDAAFNDTPSVPICHHLDCWWPFLFFFHTWCLFREVGNAWVKQSSSETLHSVQERKPLLLAYR